LQSAQTAASAVVSHGTRQIRGELVHPLVRCASNDSSLINYLFAAIAAKPDLTREQIKERQLQQTVSWKDDRKG
jgi:hypothetical protein